MAWGCTTAPEGPAAPRDPGALLWAGSPQLFSLPIGNESGFPIRYWSPVIFVVLALLVLFFTYRRTKGNGELLCWGTGTTEAPTGKGAGNLKHPRAPQNTAKLHHSWHGCTCSVWHLLGHPVPPLASAQSQANPKLSQLIPGGAVWFLRFFFQPPYCNTCLPSPTGTQEPTTSISDFSGEISAGLLLEHPLPTPTAWIHLHSLHCRCGHRRKRHSSDCP